MWVKHVYSLVAGMFSFDVYLVLFTLFLFFFNDTATTEIYTLSLHDALPISQWRSLKRWILPVAVLGSSPTNSIHRGYLYGAILSLTNAFSSSPSAAEAAAASLRTTNAWGLMRRSLSSLPTTAASSTAGCLIRGASTSTGDTQMPPTFSMSSERPAYQK